MQTLNRFLFSSLFVYFLIEPSLVFASWIIPPNTPQEDCGFVDLRDPLGPNRDQGDMGWCYANAAADLLTYKFKDLLKGEVVSAGHLAIVYNQFFDHNPDESGGLTSVALWPAQTEGFCIQSVEDKILRSGPQVGIKKKLESLIYLKQHFDKTHGESLENDLKKYFANTGSVLFDIPRDQLRDIFENSSENDFVRNFANAICGKHKITPPGPFQIPEFDIKQWYLGQTYPLMKTIHYELSRKNIVAVGYYASFLKSDGAPKDPKTAHASVVVGRRWNSTKSTCEILIRNSWGRSCNLYKAKSLQEPDACEYGNIWVDENVLKEYITDIEYFP